MRRMITSGLGFRRGWLFARGYGIGTLRQAIREMLRLTSPVFRRVGLTGRVR